MGGSKMKVELETGRAGGDAFAELECGIRAAGRAGVSRLPADPAGARGARDLGGPARVLGRRHRDRVGGARAHQPRPRAPLAAPRGPGLRDRGGARLAHRVLRHDGPGAARRARREMADHAGRPVALPLSGTRQAAIGLGSGDRRGRLSGRGGGSGPHHGRAPGKLRLYESWGFPEVWVEVPDTYTPSRRPGVRPGTTIHVPEGGAYRSVPASRPFRAGARRRSTPR